MTLDQMYRQLEVVNFAKEHLSTIPFTFDMAHRLAGSNDTVMGQPTQEEKTLGEIQSTVAQAAQSVGISAQLFDIQAITPFVERGISNWQQFMSQPLLLQIAGDLAMEIGGKDRIWVNPYEIQGNFDYIPHSGALPADPARQAELFMRMAATISNPGNAPFFFQSPDGLVPDVRKIYNEAFRAAGIKNVKEFYMPNPMAPPPMGAPGVQILPDEQVQAGVQAGNFVPPEGVQ
jgi:hypothetical protein